MRIILSILLLINSFLFGVGEAGAGFLLISPGAKSQGVGEAMVANTGTSLMSYYNPAALSFINSNSISMSYVNWLPNLTNTRANYIYHRFISLNYKYNEKHSFGGYYINLDLARENYMSAVSISYAFRLSKIASIGLNAKYIYQNIGYDDDIDVLVSKNTAYDLSYFRQINNISFGIQLANMGSTIKYSSSDVEDPAPTNLSLGFAYKLDIDETSKIKLLFQADKLLVTRYRMMDWDGDGYVGGYDKSGNWDITDESNIYNTDGRKEFDSNGYFDDPWYLAIFTAWLDDWYLGGDIDLDGDRRIGGWTWDETMDDDGNGEPDVDELEYEVDGIYGKCVNDEACIEKGSADNRSFTDEFNKMIYNVGLEYWYTDNFALRAGYIYDDEGKVINPTFGAGIRLLQYGFDFGYTAGEQGHPRANTMFFSINMKL